MKTFKFALDLSHIPEAERNELVPKKVFENFFFSAIRSGNPQGVSMVEQRILSKIMDKIDAAQGVSTVDLEDAQFEFLAKSFRAGKFLPEAYKIVNQIIDAIEQTEKK